MKSAGGVRNSSPRSRFKKLPAAAYIWGLVSAVCIITLFVLGMAALSPKPADSPLLLIYTRTADKVYVMKPALANSLVAAGFDYRFITSDDNIIPADISGRDVVVMGVGENSFALMRDINEDELKTANAGRNNILGFILVDPSYPGNLSMESYDLYNPKCEVAVFGFGKSAADTKSMGDARRLFERMSGVDTVYGPYAVRGALFGSRIYSSADQRRYLSLYGKTGYSVLINSPVFQSELAGYLGSTYGEGVSTGKINTWFVLAAAAALFGASALLMFLFFVPVMERKSISVDKVGDDGMAAIVNMGLAIWFAVLIVAGYIIPFTRDYVKYVIFLAPLAMTTVMVLMRLGFILTNKIVYKPETKGALRTFVSSVLLICYFVSLWLLVRRGSLNFGRRSVVIAIASFIVDFLCVTALGFIDKKSRAGGENGCSYFANIFYVIELLIPAGTALVISFMGMGDIYKVIRGVSLVLFPYIFSLPVKRMSDHVEFAGLVHAAVFGVLML